MNTGRVSRKRKVAYMEMYYDSTRGGERGVTASQAILQGLAKDGGLYVPQEFPQLAVSLRELAEMSYQEVAFEVMKLFLTDFTDEWSEIMMVYSFIIREEGKEEEE